MTVEMLPRATTYIVKVKYASEDAHLDFLLHRLAMGDLSEWPDEFHHDGMAERGQAWTPAIPPQPE